MPLPKLLALAMWLMPSAPRERVRPIVAAIASATSDRTEQVALLTISHWETGFGRAGVPFGASALRVWRSLTLNEIAAWSVRVLRAGVHECGSVPLALARYHTGRCVEHDTWSEREARAIDRVLRMF